MASAMMSEAPSGAVPHSEALPLSSQPSVRGGVVDDTAVVSHSSGCAPSPCGGVASMNSPDP